MFQPLMKDIGQGRIGYLTNPTKMRDVVEIVKKRFNMKTFRIALANGKTLGSQLFLQKLMLEILSNYFVTHTDDKVKSIGVCAGSGSKLLANLNVDLIITGELSHHEILHEVHRGVSVIVTDHTNTERGYFSLFKQRFESLLDKHGEKVEIILSEVDRDPLEYI